ncbi:MAG: hypothetical protein ACJ8JD_12720 [Chthoniobacterales bacterium]|jgi:hypothetical protein
MKKLVILGLAIAASTAAAQTATFNAPTTRERTTTKTTKQEVVRSAPRPVGALVRTSRNPVQLINPLAPREYYGPPDETVAMDQRDRRPDEVHKSGPLYTGVILFGFRW